MEQKINNFNKYNKILKINKELNNIEKINESYIDLQEETINNLEMYYKTAQNYFENIIKDLN